MGPRHWQSPTPESNLKQVAGFHWLNFYCAMPPGQLDIGAAILSALVPPYCIVQRISTGTMLASLGNARWAMMGWAVVHVAAIDGVAYMHFDPSASEVQIEHVVDVADWQVIPHKFTSPLRFKLNGGLGNRGIMLAQCGPPVRLLLHALSNKSGISEGDLLQVANRIISHDISQNAPRANVLDALLEHACEGMADHEREEFKAAAHKVDEARFHLAPVRFVLVPV
jgi:hypothetical protein